MTSHPDCGRRLAGKYELLELAGQGGMAEVFKARTHGAAGFTRPVAVKRILPQLTDNDEFVRMFVEEARVVSELSHPNVVQIHDFDQDDDDAYFLVMEWVEGLSLLEWSEGYRHAGEVTPWPLVAAIGIEVLKALGAAHERRGADGTPKPIYHRDVTPQNILLGVGGVVKLADFGLARAMDRSRMTAPDVVKGKLSYLCPELTRGEDASARTDIFGVGIVLWETLAGRKLFDGEGPLQVLEAVKAAQVPALDEFRLDLPRTLEDVITKALAREPEQRYRSTRKMVRALSNLLRMTPEPTGAEVLGRTVMQARERLAESPGSSSKEPTEVLDLAALEPVDATPPPPPPSAASAIPLTRKKS
ncbi:MAG: serine/threonine protein kinase [Deltaproteobacteria bacterium]|nr:serine/threonine protein kinase [Deltaproteobacteria bacterium]